MLERRAPGKVRPDSASLPVSRLQGQNSGSVPRTCVREIREIGAFFLMPSPERRKLVTQNSELDRCTFWT